MEKHLPFVGHNHSIQGDMTNRKFKQQLVRVLVLSHERILKSVFCQHGFCGGPGLRQGLVKWDLWWTNWHYGRFSLSTSVSPANLHSTKSPSSQSPGAGRIGQKWPTCRVYPIWTPSRTMRKMYNVEYRVEPHMCHSQASKEDTVAFLLIHFFKFIN
jgi:hypothetical protein